MICASIICPLNNLGHIKNVSILFSLWPQELSLDILMIDLLLSFTHKTILHQDH